MKQIYRQKVKTIVRQHHDEIAKRFIEMVTTLDALERIRKGGLHQTLGTHTPDIHIAHMANFATLITTLKNSDA